MQRISPYFSFGSVTNSAPRLFHSSWHARISATRISEKLLTLSGSAGTLSATDGLSGVGPPPTLTISRSADVGDG